MKNIIQKSKTPIGAFIIAAFFLVTGAFLSLSGVTHADDAITTQDGHLVTIYDRGMENVILSQASTIGDALKEAGITLDSKDIVEPAADQEMFASEYQVNIYRARPVTIIDGNMRTKIITAYQTATQIAASAGITLYDNDIAELGLSDDLVANGATPFSFDLYGKTATVRTQAKTVGEMLTEKGIKLSADDQVSPSQNTPITEGTAVRVWREGKQTVTVEEAVAFDVEKVEDANRDVSYREVRTAGAPGTRNVTYEIIVENGVEVSRTEIASITTKQPVKQIEVVGVLVPYTGTGTKTEWLLASGINQEDWGYVDYIISHESGWNPNSINSTSGACGLAQALPCSKVSGNPLDPVTSLKWADSYAHTCVSYRMYCGWEGAYNFWVSNKWW